MILNYNLTQLTICSRAGCLSWQVDPSYLSRKTLPLSDPIPPPPMGRSLWNGRSGTVALG